MVLQSNSSAQPFVSQAVSGPLQGDIDIPGDKSISHRAIMFGALATGTSVFTNILESDDLFATRAAMCALGATIKRISFGVYQVHGFAMHGFKQPDNILDLGNSGTSLRLLTGLLAGFDAPVFLTGDDSLRKRPLGRVIAPLSRMGCSFIARLDNHLPLMMHGAGQTIALNYRLPVPSAQVKSAILLAGLYARGQTIITEPIATRDHSEYMLKAFGVDITRCLSPQNERQITLTPPTMLKPVNIDIPCDPSSAAFAIVAGLIVPSSHIQMHHICLNPTRIGLIKILQAMGANIKLSLQSGIVSDSIDLTHEEPVGSIDVYASKLKAITISPQTAPSMIDEYPILAIAAAFAKGTTRMEGLSELRHKESDRLAAIITGLTKNAITVRHGQDWLEIDGTDGQRPLGGATINTNFDHRIAMSFLVLGMLTEKPITVDDTQSILTSFPQFIEKMNALGASMIPSKQQ